MFGFSNQFSGRYTPATDLELIRFRPLPLEDLVWRLSTQVNDGIIAAYITVSEPRRVNHRPFIPFLVYALVCPSISSNLVTLATLSPWSDYSCTHTCSPFLRKPILGWHSTVETGLLINCQLALNIFGYQQPHYLCTQELVKHV